MITSLLSEELRAIFVLSLVCFAQNWIEGLLLVDCEVERGDSESYHAFEIFNNVVAISSKIVWCLGVPS